MIPISILSIASEDDRAFMTRLYEKYHALMFKTGWEYTNDEEEINDIVSDSCVSLIQHIDQLKSMEERAVRAYIAATVRHKAVDYLRKRALMRKTFVFMNDGVPDQASKEFPIEERLSLRQELETVMQAIRTLPESEQAVLRQKFFEHRTDQEIAREMNITEARVRILIMRARKCLKDMLLKEEDES